MLKKLTIIGNSIWYWLAILVFGLGLEGVALFYQYVLDYWPCVLCIHVRIWVMGMIVVAVLALLARRFWALRVGTHLLMTGIAVGLLERSWLLLGTERGTIIGECSMNSGLPSWFALDTWFPKMFKIWEACGYTPELLFGITMAEGLMATSISLLIISGILTITTILNRN